LKKLTLEYIAGFVDGEGCFTISKSHSTCFYPALSVANTNLQILKDIRKYLSIGLKIHTKHPKNPNHKTFYILTTTTQDDVKYIATLLEPYLRIKKEQAQIIMQYPRALLLNIGGVFQEDLSTKALQQKLRNRIMRLNKTGKPGQGADEDLQAEPDPQLNLLDLKQKEVTKT